MLAHKTNVTKDIIGTPEKLQHELLYSKQHHQYELFLGGGACCSSLDAAWDTASPARLSQSEPQRCLEGSSDGSSTCIQVNHTRDVA